MTKTDPTVLERVRRYKRRKWWEERTGMMYDRDEPYMNEFDRQTDWLDYARCKDMEPALFDDPDHPEQALEACFNCPVQQLCIGRVRPEENYYDGVAGGYVFRRGVREVQDSA